MKYKYWPDIVREVFPGAAVVDDALILPVTDHGWKLNLPAPKQFPWRNRDFRLVINLQDMLHTGADDTLPAELKTVHDFYSQFDFVDMNKIIVLVWPMGLKKDWNTHSSDTFNLIEFSSHTYETWCSYKDAEDVIREAFCRTHKDFEFNYVCPQRLYKPHRAALHSSLDDRVGNISLQTKGIELKYPSLSVEEYDACYDNLANLLAMKKNYNTSLFTVVSESQYREEYGIITEKTFNAIVAGHPFLLCAHQYALVQLQALGFITYNTLFDETYDELDNVVRMKDMLDSNAHFIHERMSAVEMQDIYDQLDETITYNRDYYFNHFGDQMVSELRMELLDLWGK